MKSTVAARTSITALLAVQCLSSSLRASYGETSSIGMSTNVLEMWTGACKEDANGLSVELFWQPLQNNKPVVIVSVGSRRFTNSTDYFAPPKGYFSQVTLTDSTGASVARPRKDLQGEFPSRIPVTAMPRWHDGVPKGRLAFAPSIPPPVLVRFPLEDAFEIRKSGVFKLTLCAVIYKFETNKLFLDRVDLPCVSTNIYTSQP